MDRFRSGSVPGHGQAGPEFCLVCPVFPVTSPETVFGHDGPGGLVPGDPDHIIEGEAEGTVLR